MPLWPGMTLYQRAGLQQQQRHADDHHNDGRSPTPATVAITKYAGGGYHGGYGDDEGGLSRAKMARLPERNGARRTVQARAHQITAINSTASRRADPRCRQRNLAFCGQRFSVHPTDIIAVPRAIHGPVISGGVTETATITIERDPAVICRRGGSTWEFNEGDSATRSTATVLDQTGTITTATSSIPPPTCHDVDGQGATIWREVQCGRWCLSGAGRAFR